MKGTMIDEKAIEAVVAAIRRGDSFVITSHVAQDGDNMSSQLALARILDKLGKRVDVVDRDPVPERWRFLPTVERVRQAERVTEAADFALVLDTTRIERTGLDFSAVRPPTVLVNIDHHQSNEHFGDINWVEPQLPASSYLVYLLAKRLGVEMDRTLATCLFTGIMTDTGYFHYSGTTQETFQVAADLIAHGAPHIELYRQVYDEKPLSEMRLMGHALADLRTMEQDRIAWIEITPDTLARAQASFHDVGSVANSLTTIRGVDVGLTFEERGRARTLVEIRSRGRVDVGTIARELGGGGHHNASGCTLEVPLDHARAMVLERIQRAVSHA
jgi:phosphoesterase RecJ-like protein